MTNTNPKYADLPGIACDQPDIYETNDLPESDQLPIDVYGDQSENVEKLNVTATDAYQKFQGKENALPENTANADAKKAPAACSDFTDNIKKQCKTGYDVTSGDWEMLGNGNTSEKETLQQRYQRLQHETRELLEDVNKVKEDSKQDKKVEQLSPVVLAQQVGQVQQQLIQLNLTQTLGSDIIANLADPQGTLHKKLLSQLETFKESGLTANPPKVAKREPQVTASDAVTYELFYKPEHSKLTQVSKISDLEGRMKKLEGLLGCEDSALSLLTVHASEKSITSALNALSARLSLLDISNLEQVESRLSCITQRLQAAGDKRTHLEEADSRQASKVDELYNLARKADAMSSTLPRLVERMVALQQLHEQALQFSKALTQLDTVQQQIVSALKNNEKLLQQTQGMFQKNSETIQKNVASLDQRMAVLKK